MSRFTRRKKVAVLGVVAVLGAGAVALAYWTAGGSGSGSASAGNTTALTVNQTSTVNAMYPGDSPQTLSGNFDNTNSGPIHVGTVTAAKTSVSNAGPGGCDVTDFTLTDNVATVNAEVPAGNGVGSWSGPKVQFDNKASNQDGCKGATLNLSYTIG